jgi:hypothetical protein
MSTNSSDSALKVSTKQVMKVYAARNYDIANPRLTNYVQVNVPEYTPTVPQDDSYEQISLSGSYFVNTNFPVTTGTITMSHCLELPLLGGSNCPVYFDKGTPFLLFTPTTKIEEGYLLYI